MIDDPKVDKKRISILGCGWLGFPLAQRLRHAHITWKVKGSTTSESKLQPFRDNGIEGYLLDLTPAFESPQVHSFFESDVLIVLLPPRLTQKEPGFYVQQMQSVISEVAHSAIKDVIFISSTGVYPDLNRIVTEDDVNVPEDSPSMEMVLAENLMQSLRPEKTVTILRLGGLLGNNRNPGKYVAGKKDMTTGDIPVNYIHRDDAVGIISKILESGLQNETYNIVAPLHTTRREVYEDSCKRFGWEAPTFITPAEKPDFKLISNEKFARSYAYEFKFPDPLKFYYSLEDEI